MSNNMDGNNREKVIQFIMNFLETEGFTEVSRPEIEEDTNVKIVDQITQKVYFPTLSAHKDGQLYIIDVETNGKYDSERILKWKLYMKYLEENRGVFWMFVPSISKEIFEASLKQNKLEGQVELVAY